MVQWYSDPYEGQESDRPVLELWTDIETAFQLWRQMVVTNWKFLLVSGGILDQPEAEWHDIIQIQSYNLWYRRTTGIDPA